MGQYYKAVNLDKRQFLKPWSFGDGAKLLEFGASPGGLMTGLAILLADGNNRGGGDLRSDHPLIGSWAGDRVVITGDYADVDKFCPIRKRQNLYHYADTDFEDISFEVIEVMGIDPYLKRDLILRTAWHEAPELDRILGTNRRKLAEQLERENREAQARRFTPLRPDLVLTSKRS